jgi:CBS domain-containing protein
VKLYAGGGVPILVKDIMSKPVYFIDLNKTARDAGKLMREKRRGFLVVTKDKKPVGVISDSDLINDIVAKNKKAGQVKIKNVMKSPIVTIKPDDNILEAVRKMKKNNIHRLPVVDAGKLVGVISLTDIARTSPEMLDLLEYRLKMKELPFEIKEEFTSGICDSCGNYFDELKYTNDQWLCETCREERENEI